MLAYSEMYTLYYTSPDDETRTGHVGRDSLPAVNDELVNAIGGKYLVEFAYKAGRTRIVEPHDYGIRHGVERLLGFQIGGESQSGAPQGWNSSTSITSTTSWNVAVAWPFGSARPC